MRIAMTVLLLLLLMAIWFPWKRPRSGIKEARIPGKEIKLVFDQEVTAPDKP